MSIKYFLPTELTLPALSFLSRFELYLHQIQPTHFLQQAIDRGVLILIETLAKSIFERLHVTCPNTLRLRLPSEC